MNDCKVRKSQHGLIFIIDNIEFAHFDQAVEYIKQFGFTSVEAFDYIGLLPVVDSRFPRNPFNTHHTRNSSYG